jgi:hypothetical protein
MEEASAVVERGIALGGALIVGTTALTSLLNEWKARGIDNEVTKIMLGLLTLGCFLVVLASFKALGAWG